jgi:hypothetical protein
MDSEQFILAGIIVTSCFSLAPLNLNDWYSNAIIQVEIVLLNFSGNHYAADGKFQHFAHEC